jgi:hypothetical protein
MQLQEVAAMTSSEDSNQKIPVLPLTGIEVMNDLSIDATKVLYLAHEDLLKPYIPTGLTKRYFMLCMNSHCDSPESFLSSWMYRESDVEEFKLKHKDFLEELRKQIVKTWKYRDHTEDDKEKALEPTDTKKPLPQPINFFAREGDVWHIGFEGQTTRIRHLDGIYYIAILLQKPGKSISCRELYQTLSGKMQNKILSAGAAIAEGLNIGGSKQAISDPKVRKEYIKKYMKLENDLLKINDLSDNDRTPEDEMVKKEIEKEMATIKPFLNVNTFADPNDKKAQVNIGKRLDTAYKAIRRTEMKEMEKHLRGHIKPDDAYGLFYTGSLTWDITL